MAYQNPTVTASPTPTGNGSWRIQLTFTGNAGEEPQSRWFDLQPGQDTNELRYWVGEEKARLDSAKTLANAPAVAVGQTITPQARPAKPAPTAVEAALILARRVQRAESLGAIPAGALADAITQLRADLVSAFAALTAPQKVAFRDSF